MAIRIQMIDMSITTTLLANISNSTNQVQVQSNATTLIQIPQDIANAVVYKK